MAAKFSRGFLQSVSKWTKETEERSTEVFQESVKTMYDKLYAATPVDTSALRNSLTIHRSGDSPSSDVTGINYVTGAGGRNYAVADSLKLGERVQFSYGRVYWRILEYGFVGVDSLGRNVNRQGRFFITTTLAQWRSVVRETARSLRGRV